MNVDKEFVDRVVREERDAQRELYELFAGRMLSIALRYVGQRDYAEDVVHDSFIKVFRSIGGFNYRGKGALRAWIERITVNTALEWLRTNKRIETVSLDESYQGGGGVEELCSEPDSTQIEGIPIEQLYRLIGELPNGYRTIFNLFHIDGYSHREIGEILGINERSSSSQLLRARRQLAEKINEYIANNE